MIFVALDRCPLFIKKSELIKCVNLLLVITRDSLLFADRRLSFRIPKIKTGFCSIHKCLKHQIYNQRSLHVPLGVDT